jgi:hypothetical protein
MQPCQSCTHPEIQRWLAMAINLGAATITLNIKWLEMMRHLMKRGYLSRAT